MCFKFVQFSWPRWLTSMDYSIEEMHIILAYLKWLEGSERHIN